jgi:hypothetical protein
MAREWSQSGNCLKIYIISSELKSYKKHVFIMVQFRILGLGCGSSDCLASVKSWVQFFKEIILFNG